MESALVAGGSAKLRGSKWALAASLELDIHPERADALHAHRPEVLGFYFRSEVYDEGGIADESFIVTPVGYLYFIIVGEGLHKVAQLIELEAIGDDAEHIRTVLRLKFISHCDRVGLHSVFFILPPERRSTGAARATRRIGANGW